MHTLEGPGFKYCELACPTGYEDSGAKVCTITGGEEHIVSLNFNAPRVVENEGTARTITVSY